MGHENHANATDLGEWLTLEEAAKYLRKPRSWMYDNVHRERIPHVVLGRQYRFSARELDAWMRNKTAYRMATTTPT